jgi:hypothetical protein
MHDLRFQREKIEKTLEYMLSDRAPDGTPIDPGLYNEDEYQRSSGIINDINRAMYVIYAQLLDMDPALARKASANNLPPEPGRRPDTFGEFYSSGSFMDS